MEIMRSSPKPLRFNVDSNAHFITDYDNDMFDSIVNQISNGELSPIDRLQFLNEQNILANAGIINNSRLINLLSAFKNETIESVWDIISLTIGELKKFTDDDNLAEAKLRQLAADIAGKQYARLGWIKLQNEPETDTKLRSTILGLMLYAENPDVISTAIKLFHTNKIDNLDPELISIILTAVVRHEAKPVDIKMLIKEYSTTESAELKQDICGSLTAVRDSETIGKLLALIKNTAIIRPQDTARWLVYLLRNKYGRVIVWQWIRDNWSWIDSTFSDDKSYDDYPRYAAAILSTKKQFQEYQDFFEPMLSNPALTRVINMGINEIKNRISVIDRDGESVKKTLLNL
jgi:aminopeptidase N